MFLQVPIENNRLFIGVNFSQHPEHNTREIVQTDPPGHETAGLYTILPALDIAYVIGRTNYSDDVDIKSTSKSATGTIFHKAPNKRQSNGCVNCKGVPDASGTSLCDADSLVFAHIFLTLTDTYFSQHSRTFNSTHNSLFPLFEAANPTHLQLIHEKSSVGRLLLVQSSISPLI